MSSVALALTVPLLAGCVGSISRERFDEIVQERGGGVTTELLDGAIAALTDELGAEPDLRHLTINPASRNVMLEVRDSLVRENVDNYLYRDGNLGDPDPVRVSSTELLEGTTFRRSEVPALADLEALADAALAAFGFEGGYVATINVDGRPEPIAVPGPIVMVNVSSPRADGVARFDANGTLVEAVRS